MSCCSLGKEIDLLIKKGLSHHRFPCTSKTAADEPYHHFAEIKLSPMIVTQI